MDRQIANQGDLAQRVASADSVEAGQKFQAEAVGAKGESQVAGQANVEGKALLAQGASQANAEGKTLVAQAASQADAEGKALVAQGKLGNLEVVDKTKTKAVDDDPDSEHIEVGAAINWSPEARANARPLAGQGYNDVMEKVGSDLLGRAPLPEELQSLVLAARAMQEQRGKNPDTLSTHDELLPKNEDEMAAFMQGLSGNTSPSPLDGRQLEAIQQTLSSSFQQHMAKLTGDQIVFTERKVTDQPIVTNVVPDAVYVDSSNIAGGQGYRRKPDCSHETQDYWLSKPTADAFIKAQQWLIQNHHDPMQIDNMNGAGRRALDRELISKCAPDQIHALKHSTHENGISIDVDNYDDKNVQGALVKFGFVHNVPSDHPHYTYLPKKK